jgi:hypothetical protein
MHAFRSFYFNNSPLIALGLVIIGLYAMAICIGVSMRYHN